MRQLLSFILIASTLGCGGEQKPTTQIVDVMGIDHSLSVKDFVLPDSSYIRRLISARTATGDTYTLAIGCIGTASDKPLLVLHVSAIPTIDASAAPSIRKRQRRAIDSIRQDNNQRIGDYLQKLQRQILDSPATATLSNINQFNRKAATLLSEPTFRGGNSIRCLTLISDCEQDSSGKAGDKLLNPFAICPDFKLYLVGCKHADVFKGITTEQFQSVESLLLYLQQTINSPIQN